MSRAYHKRKQMQPNQPVHHPVVRHIVRNFNIFGFGTEHSALLQSTKELMENSIDACRMNKKSDASTSAKISITITDAERGVFLDVTDNGMGIADPTSVLRCFQTGKDGGQTCTAGRFGVGLSTCLIYSLVNTGTPMRIVTKCGAVMEATVADFSLDRAQNPVCVQSKSIALAGMQSGTKIRVHLPLAASGRAEMLRDVFVTVRDYLMRLACHPHGQVVTELRVDCAAFKRSFTSSAVAPAPAAPAPITASAFADSFQTTFVPLLGPARCCIAASCAIVEKLALEVTACACIVGHSSNHPALAQGHGEHISAAVGPAEESMQQSAALPLRVWRYANHVPLLEAGDDALSCATAGALRALRWAEYGYKLRLALDPLPASEDFLGPQGGDDAGSGAVAEQSRLPNWQLQAQRPELAARVQEEGLQVLLVVDVSGAKVPFANMRKTALSKEDAAVVRLIQQGIQSALAGLEADAEGPRLFESKKLYKTRLMTEQYIPSIARSLTKIVHCTKDARYIRWAQRTLGLPAGDRAEGGEADAECSSGGDGSQDFGQSAASSGGEDEGTHADAGAEAMRRCITERLRSIVSRPGNQGL